MQKKTRLTFLSFFVGLTICVLGPVSFAAPAKLTTQKTAPQPIQEHSRKLELIAKAAFDFWGAQEISIGGGTARSLIQAALTGAPFQFRDFDVVLSAGREVTASEAQKFGEELEHRGIGKLSLENLRPRPRYNPDLDGEKRYKYNAGYGFFVMDSQNTEYDVTLFHTEKDLNLNGIMDVDCLRVVLRRGQTLGQIMASPALFRKAIRDPFKALAKITSGRGHPLVANWGDVERDPGNISVRIIRSLGKFNALPLDAFTQQRIQAILEKNNGVSELQLARNLLKLFQDSNWNLEYEAVVKAGVFDHHFQSFARVQFTAADQALPMEKRLESFLKKTETEDGLHFMKILSSVEPLAIQAQLPRFIRNKKLKVGYFTGEFAPFHKGHFGVVQTALRQGGLDLLFVLPTPHATNDPKTPEFSPLEYSERLSFVKAGLLHEPHAWVWPFLKATPLEAKLDKAVAGLEAFLKPVEPLTHVFGMDSFYRVLHRELMTKDPRPRIVVTRPGVPVPDFPKDPNIRVIENRQSMPISATRILHSLAVNGSSDDLAPEVQEEVLKTDRYRDLLAKLVEGREEAAVNIADSSSLWGKTLIWDPRENHAGLYNPEVPVFSEKHMKIFRALKALGAEEVIVSMENSAAARASWMEQRRKFFPMMVRISDDASGVRASDQVMVRHSGVINENLKRGLFSREFRGERGLIVFETPDQPLSPLISSLAGLRVLRTEPVRQSCSRVHRKLAPYPVAE